MWYSKVIESATAWDVLSTKEVSWSGSFSRTFKDFSFYSTNKMPTMTAMLKLLAEIEKGKNNDSIIDKYFEQAKSDITAMSDIITFSRGLAKFIDNEMKKQGSSANTDMMKILDFLGKLNSFSKSQGQKGNTLGDQIPDPEKAKTYVNSTLGIGFTTLNLLVRKGTEINDSISLFVLAGRKPSIFGFWAGRPDP